MLKLLQADGSFTQFAARILKIASDLEDLANIQLVKHQMALIMELQTDAYWEGITPEMLENVRRALRELVQLIEPMERKIVYTDFTDDIGLATEIAVEAASPGMDKLRFTMKVRRFLERHKDHLALLKLRRAEQMTDSKRWLTTVGASA